MPRHASASTELEQVSPRLAALVTDVQLRSAVAGLRGLGLAGPRVFAAASRRSAAGLWSRHTHTRFIVPDVLEDGPRFRDSIARLASERGPLVVYPGREASIDALVGSDGMPPEAVLPYPGRSSLEQLRDKRNLRALATSVGLSSPATLLEATPNEAIGVQLQLPCVVKPAVPRTGPLPTARVLQSADELRALLEELPPREPLLFQERLAGKAIVLALVIARDGRLVSRFQQTVHTTWPAPAGSTSRATSSPPDSDLIERVLAMLRGVGFWGLAQLDVIEGRQEYFVLDVNPRFYDSMPLALACGVNLPADWHAVTTGVERSGPSLYRVGVTFRWLEADLVAAVRGSPARLRRAPAAVGAMWDVRDPCPGLLLGADAALARVRRRLP